MKKEKQKFDIVFLCHEKDIDILKKNLEYARENIIGYRKIFIVSRENYFSNDKNLTFVDEKLYPFSKEDIAKQAPKGRAGWYYQQFLKLYFLKVIGKRALDNVLIVDADCSFIKPTTFFERDKPLYSYEIGFHEPYYKILEKLFGFGNQLEGKSGTVHHMMYQREYILEILSFVEKKWKNDFWRVVMDLADKDSISGFSEQDLYFNYMLKNHKKKMKIRRLKFVDFKYNSRFWASIFRVLGYSYIASHVYLQNERFSAIKRIVIEILKVLRIKILLKKTLIKLRVVKVK